MHRLCRDTGLRAHPAPARRRPGSSPWTPAASSWRGGPGRAGGCVEFIRRGICFVPGERDARGLILSMSVAGNTTLANLDAVTHGPVMDLPASGRLAQQYVKALAVQARSVQQEVQYLSGGNRQKVMLSKWLCLRRGGVSPGRADAGRGRGGAGRDPPHHEETAGGGKGHPHGVFGPRRAHEHEPSHRGNEQGADRGPVWTRRRRTDRRFSRMPLAQPAPPRRPRVGFGGFSTSSSGASSSSSSRWSSSSALPPRCSCPRATSATSSSRCPRSASSPWASPCS